MLTIRESVSLRSFSTMRLGGKARYACTVTTEEELQEAVVWANTQNVPFIAVGSGNNIVWKDEGFDGLLIINRIRGIVFEDNIVRAGAGEPWDAFVEQTVENGWYGVERLSLIPGTVGATPVQNVGAYGSEVAETITSIRAFDTLTRVFVDFQKDQCNFGYRTSRFKTVDRGRYIITRVDYALTKTPPTKPYYDSLQKYVDNHGIIDITPRTLRNSVIAIRSDKLPDPAVVANNGSFFANPVVSADQYEQLKNTYPNLKAWKTGQGYKLPAGWLIEQAGFHDYHDAETGMATWANQNLVLVNEYASSTAQLIRFRDMIVGAVQEKFGVTLEQEPELLP